MADIREVVQSMLDAGEPDWKIKKVVEAYKNRKAEADTTTSDEDSSKDPADVDGDGIPNLVDADYEGKENVSQEDASAGQENTASSSEESSLDSLNLSEAAQQEIDSFRTATDMQAAYDAGTLSPEAMKFVEALSKEAEGDDVEVEKTQKQEGPTTEELARYEESAFKKYVQDLNIPGVKVEEYGIANAARVKIPGEGYVNIDLRPFTDSGMEEAKAKIQKILDFKKETDNQDLSYLSDFSSAKDGAYYSPKQLEFLNTSYGEHGYRLEQQELLGKPNGIYDIYKEGELIKSLRVDDLQDFMHNEIQGMADEDKSALLEDVQDSRSIFYNNFKDNQLKATKAKVEEATTPQKMEKGYIESDAFADAVISNISFGSDPEREAMFNTVKMFAESTPSSELADEIQQHLSAGYFSDYAETIRDGVISALNVDNFTEGVTQHKINVINEISTTQAERAMKESGMSNIILAHNNFEDKEVRQAELALKEQETFLREDMKLFENRINNKSDKLFQAASSEGVTDVSYDKITGTYSVTANTTDAAEKYTRKFNKLAEEIKLKQDDLLATSRKLEESRDSISKRREDVNSSSFMANKNYSYGVAMQNDITNSFSNFFASVPALFGNEEAIASINAMAETTGALYETQKKYSEVETIGESFKFAGRAIAQQSAPLAVALVTAGVGSTLGLGTSAISNLTAASFAVTSGGGKRAELETTIIQADEAKVALEELNSKKDLLSPEYYNKQRKNLEDIIDAGTMTNGQKWGMITATGVIEGVVTRHFGTIPNASKAWKNFVNPVDDVVGLMNRSNLQATIKGVGTFGKRTLSEVLEEELIHFGTAGSEALILGKEFNAEGWDDVAVSSVLVAGAMNGPGIAYSTIVQQGLTAEIREEYNALINEINDIDNMLEQNISEESRNILRDKKIALKSSISNLTLEMELSAMDMGANDLVRAIRYSNELRELDAVANVDPTDPEDVQEAIRQEYINSLDSESANKYKAEREILLAEKDKFLNRTVDWDNIIAKSYGVTGTKILERLMEKNPALKNASAKEKAIAVHKEFKAKMDRSYISKAKKDPYIKQQVEQHVYGDEGRPKRRSRAQINLENDLYLQYGKYVANKRADAIVVNHKESESLKSLMTEEALQNLNVTETRSDEELYNSLEKAYAPRLQEAFDKIDNDSSIPADEKEIEKDNARAAQDGHINDLVNQFKSGETNALIIGGNYIVRDARAAKEAIKRGDLLAGTAMSHEVSHAVDNLAMDQAGIRNFGENLLNHIEGNYDHIHQEAMFRMSNTGAEYAQDENENYIINEQGQPVLKPYYDASLPMEEQSDLFFDEYTKSVQDIFRANPHSKDYRKLLKTKPGLKKRIGSLLSGDFKINNDVDAAAYLVSFMEGFREGKLGKLQKRKIKSRTSKPTTADIRDSKSANRAEVEINKLMKNPDGSQMTKDQWDIEGFGNAAEKLVYSNFLDGRIVKGIDIDPNNPNVHGKPLDEFIEDVKYALVKPLMSFNPEKNDNLSGYLSPYISWRKGDVAKEQKARAKTTSLDKTMEGKEGSIMTQQVEDTSAQDAFEELEISLTEQASTEEQSGVERNSVFRRKLKFDGEAGINDKMVAQVKAAAAKVLSTEKALPNDKNFLLKLQKGFKTELKKIVQDKMGQKHIYDNFLKDNLETIINHLPLSTLIQMERDINPEDRVFTVEVKKNLNPTEVDEAVKAGKLPKSVNRLSGPTLYEKRMPSIREFMDYFLPPAMVPSKKDPSKMVRSGLKGTRKDTLAEQIATEMAFDATMEVMHNPDVAERRALSTGKDVDEVALAELARVIDRGVNLKFSKTPAKSIADAVMGLDRNGYLDIKFSKKHRDNYIKRLKKKRPDIKEGDLEGQVDNIYLFVSGLDESLTKKRSKFEKLAFHYLSNGSLVLPEDGYKVIEAEKLAAKNKIDPFSVKDPEIIMQKFVDSSKEKRVDPDTVGELSNKTELIDGFVVYDVEDSKNGQRAVRRIADSHFGKKFNNWCLCARLKPEPDYEIVDEEELDSFTESLVEGGYEIVSVDDTGIAYEVGFVPKNADDLHTAFTNWERYNAEGNGFKIAFRNGKLVAFRDGDSMSWWDINDHPSEGAIIKGETNEDGVTSHYLVNLNKNTKSLSHKTKGKEDKIGWRKWSLEGELLESVNEEGSTKTILDNNGYDIKVINKDADGKLHGVQKEGHRVSDSKDWFFEFETNYVRGVQHGESIERNRRLEKVIITDWDNGKLVNGTISYRGEAQIPFKHRIVDGNERSKEQKEATSRDDKIAMTIGGKPYTIYRSLIISDKKMMSESGAIEVEGVEGHVRSYSNNKLVANIFRDNLIVELDLQTLQPTGVALYYSREGDEDTSPKRFTHAEEYSNGEIVDLNVTAEEASKFSDDFGLGIKFSKSGLTNKNRVGSLVGLSPDYVADQLTSAFRLFGEFGDHDLKFWNKAHKLGLNTNLIEKAIDVGVFNIVKEEFVKFKSPLGKMFANKQLGSNSSEYIAEYFRLDNLENVDKLTELVDMQVTVALDLMNSLPPELVRALGKESFMIGLHKRFKEQRVAITNAFNDRTKGLDGASESVKAYGIDRMNKVLQSGVFNKISNWSLKEFSSTEEMFNDFSNKYSERLEGAKSGNAFGLKTMMRAFADLSRSKPKSLVALIKMLQNPHVAGLRALTPSLTHVWMHPGNTMPIEDVSTGKFLKKIGSKTISSYRANRNHPLYKEARKEALRIVKVKKSTRDFKPGSVDLKNAIEHETVKLLSPKGEHSEAVSNLFRDLTVALTWYQSGDITLNDFDSIVNDAINSFKQILNPKIISDMTDKTFGSANVLGEISYEAVPKNIAKYIINTETGRPITEDVKDLISESEAFSDLMDKLNEAKNNKTNKEISDNTLASKSPAEIKFSKSLDPEFNQMLERNKGIDAGKRYDSAIAKRLGRNKGGWEFFVPPGAEDFQGLMMRLEGRGKQGEMDRAWFKKALYDPYNMAYRNINAMKQTIADDFAKLQKTYPKITKKLRKILPGTEFTYDQAIRVYLWQRAGMEIPGLSDKEAAKISMVLSKDKDALRFALGLGKLSKVDEGYIAPDKNWVSQSVNSDLYNIVEKIYRPQFLQKWQENVDTIFSTDNLNKLEATMGRKYVEALKDILYRMKNGKNRPSGYNEETNKWLNWVNNSVGAIMFLNGRSAVLQMISTVNYINFEDNNVAAAAKAFANQKQYWNDVAMIFNSPMLKQRRSGLQTDVTHQEIADVVSNASNKFAALSEYLLKVGFTPTQIADSLAISLGGSTFYRNRVNKYINQGMTRENAETQAFSDFQEITEENQQSARPDRISQQQATVLGRIILAFANTPMQYARIIKKSSLDLVNGRGDWRANVSRIAYYGFIQSVIFSGMQKALFAPFLDDEEDEEEKSKTISKKLEQIAQGTLDSLLRGSGLKGAVVSALKNAAFKYHEEKGKEKWKRDWFNVVDQLLGVSPPVGSKVSKVYRALTSSDWNEDAIEQMDWHNPRNPAWSAVTSVVEGLTNRPVNRMHRKLLNSMDAMDARNATWQRILLGLGWTRWNLGMGKHEEVAAAQTKGIEERKEKKKKERELKKTIEKQSKEIDFREQQEKERARGVKKVKCASVNKSGDRCNLETVGKGMYCTIHQKTAKRADGKKVQCKKIKSDGKRCKVETSNKSGLCYYHD